MGIIAYNGKRSIDYGLIVERYPAPNKPARRGTVLQIPGRNGSLVIEDGTYENVTLKFDVYISAETGGIYGRAMGIANWLLGSSGYQELSTEYEPDTFRLARFAGPLDIEAILNSHGRATLEFDCYPQQYIALGQIYGYYDNIATDGSYIIENLYYTVAKPMIKVTGKGYVSLYFSNDASTDTTEVGIQFSENQTETIILDCDLHDAYYADGSNANAVVSFHDPYGRVPEDTHYFYPTFPSFYPGENTVALGEFFTGTISGLRIAPRWWTL